MNKRFMILAAMLFVFTMLVSAPALAQGATLNVAWPYQVPPTGHFNTFASGGITLGQYQDLHEPPLAVLMWATGDMSMSRRNSAGMRRQLCDQWLRHS